MSEAEASSTASFDVPAGQGRQLLDDTNSLTLHRVASQLVFCPEASSPPTFVVPECGEYVGSKRWMKEEGEYLDQRLRRKKKTIKVSLVSFPPYLLGNSRNYLTRPFDLKGIE